MDDDIRIRLARDRSDYDTCVLLQKVVWGLADLEVTSAIQLIATTHAGGLLQIAETGAGNAVNGEPGAPSITPPLPNASFDGSGQTQAACNDPTGKPAAPGSNAPNSPAASPPARGTLTAQGWLPGDGSRGNDGPPGQGGGGGGSVQP